MAPYRRQAVCQRGRKPTQHRNVHRCATRHERKRLLHLHKAYVFKFVYRGPVRRKTKRNINNKLIKAKYANERVFEVVLRLSKKYKKSKKCFVINILGLP